jgi:hypothetical protein
MQCSALAPRRFCVRLAGGFRVLKSIYNARKFGTIGKGFDGRKNVVKSLRHYVPFCLGI